MFDRIKSAAKWTLSIILFPLQMLLSVTGESPQARIFVFGFAGLYLFCTVLWIVTFPWLALALFIGGFYLPFFLDI